MAETQALLAALNAGEISRLALARVDLAKLRIACEQQSNWLPHVLGPSMMRPGLWYTGASTASHAAGWLGEFYFDESTKVLLVATANGLQFFFNDAYLTRPAVTAAVTNGNFDTDLTGWTDSDEAGATSSWIAGGALSLAGTGTNYAYRDQQVTVNEVGVEHALRVIIDGGTVVLKVGTAAGDTTYLDVTLAAGTYSLAFTPGGASFWIRLGANTTYASRVNSINVEGAGAVSIPVPWSTTAHFDSIRYDQSGDVVFVASAGFQQRRIERRASDSRSWGLAFYFADDGPFRLSNTATGLTITPSATTGFVTLTASRNLFKSTHVGALYRLVHASQTVTKAIASANDFTSEIRVSGLASHSGSPSSRGFAITITGAYTAVVTLQRSIGAPGAWSDVKSWTNTEASETYDDGLDNQIIYYRLGVKAGNYTAGTATCTLNYNGSSQTGIARINGYSSPTSVTADVLKEFGGTGATDDWAEGEWSDYRGWPVAVALHDGRLFWGTGIKAQGSVSDAFASFDDEVEGDSGPLNKTVATGGLDGWRWLLSLQRLIGGTAAQEISIRASAFDEPLTPTQFVARACSTRGAAKVRPIKVDEVGIFVERNAKRVFQLSFETGAIDYRSSELTRLKQEMCNAGVRDVAVQRQPDTRVWFVLGDGTCAVLTYDLADEVVAWTPVVTNGSFERVAVLPGSDEDDVYFIVARSVSGTKRYIEKLTKRSESVGGTLSKTIDSHIVYSGAPTTTITGLGHLEGKNVVVWGDGKAQVTNDAPKTVTGGQITGLPVAVSNAVVGLSYVAELKTAKLAYGAEQGTAMTLQKRVARVGLVAADVSIEGLRIGRDFSHLTRAATTYKGKAITAGQVLSSFDAPPGAFGGEWNSDARACIEVKSPHCATIMGLVLEMTTNEPETERPSRGR